jgi:hypothetical protein
LREGRSAAIADPADSANATALTANRIRFIVVHFLINVQDLSSISDAGKIWTL